MVFSAFADVTGALRKVFLDVFVSFRFKAKKNSKAVGKLFSPGSNQWSL